MTIHFAGRRRHVFVSAIFAAGLAATVAPAQAGFLEDLFGGGAPQAPSIQAPPSPEPGYGYEPGYDAPAPRHHAKKKIVAALPKEPVLQKTTDLMDDKTLRPGDAVMMKTGMHVYAGPEDSHHDADQFVALDEARRIPKKAYGELVAMDMTRAPAAVSSTSITEGRSAADKPVIAVGYKITDARGKSIRYVGP